MSEPHLQVELDGEVVDLEFPEFEAEVRAQRIGAHHRLRFEPVTGDAFVPAGDLELFLSIEDAPETRFMRRFDSKRAPRVTISMVVVLLLTFLWQLRQPGGLDDAALLRQGAKSLPHQLELGQWWRLGTASMLHASWLHLLPNLAYLAFVGWRVESVLGASATLLLLVASGLGAMGLSTALTSLATVGASGMAFGLFGAAVTVGWRFGPWLPRRARVRYGWPMVPFVAGFLAVGMTSPTLDNMCHLGGLLTGGLLGLVLPSSLTEARPLRRGLIRVVLSGLLLGLVGLAMPLLAHADLLGGASIGREQARSDEGGWALRPPRGWQPQAPLDAPSAWQSRTGVARVSVASRVEPGAPATQEAVRRRWVAELEEHAVVLPRTGPAPASLGLDDDWFTLECDLVSRDRVWRSLRAGRIRGVYVTTLEFLHEDEHVDSYARLRSRIGQEVVLLPPRGLARALEGLTGKRLSSPEAIEAAVLSALPMAEQAPAEGLRVAAELARLGRAEDARRYLDALGDSTEGEVQYWTLWTDFHLGGDEPDIARARELAAAAPDSITAAALSFDVLLAADDPGAREVLDRMLSRWPQSDMTRQRRARMP
jgi:membrane associated rhomboid family serine protease